MTRVPSSIAEVWPGGERQRRVALDHVELRRTDDRGSGRSGPSPTGWSDPHPRHCGRSRPKVGPIDSGAPGQLKFDDLQAEIHRRHSSASAGPADRRGACQGNPGRANAVGERPHDRSVGQPSRMVDGRHTLPSMANSYDIGVIGGDFIGPEVTAEAVKVLRSVAASSAASRSTPPTTTSAPPATWPPARCCPTACSPSCAGRTPCCSARSAACRTTPSCRPAFSSAGLLLKLRFALEHCVNLRPSRLWPGAISPLADPGDIDFVVVREGTEGPYVGNGGSVRTGTPNEIATEVSVNTAFGIERVVRDAFARAQARPRRSLTLVHKTNVMVHSGNLWNRVFQQVKAEFPDVTTSYLHVDAATIVMATRPAIARRGRDRQPVRRHHHRPGSRGHRRHRPGRQREHQPDAHRAVDVRAGARNRSRHRRHGKGRPHGGGALGRA